MTTLGDILKLRATHHSSLAHLTDCLVFASIAKPGRHAPPSMSSGGDLDGTALLLELEVFVNVTYFCLGDEFFVCWDSDLIPKKISEVGNL